MNGRRWFNPSLPQTLQIATFLLYFNGFWLVVYGAFTALLGLALLVANVAGGFGIANERRWGYGLGLVAAFSPFVLRLAFNGLDGVFGINIISLMFEIALVALLLHPQSRDYQRVWFR